MSYWGNTFMPTVDALACPLIREFAVFSGYTEKELRSAWNKYIDYAYEVSEGDVYKHFDQTIDNLKDFFNDVIEKELWVG